MSKETKKSLQQNPGAAIDSADRDHVSPQAVCEDVDDINNNPRNNDDKMPG